MESLEESLQRLVAATIDGRTESIRYRQDQLQSLHRTFAEEASAICDALAGDSNTTLFSNVEIETEFLLGMDAVRKFYEELDFDKELESEYSIAKGKNNKGRRVGVGIVLIRPTTHSRFYSVVEPLAAAIAGGNCIVVEVRYSTQGGRELYYWLIICVPLLILRIGMEKLQDTSLQMDSVLCSVLTKALDINTFCCISHETLTEDGIKTLLKDTAVLLVDQTAESATVTLPKKQLLLSSASTARTVAIVDRTAGIETAARAITRARFRFGGASPYAPDLVFVHEFVKKTFFEACVRHTALAFAGESTSRKTHSAQHNRNRSDQALRDAITDAEGKKQIESFGSDQYKVVDILDKSVYPLFSIVYIFSTSGQLIQKKTETPPS
jgi:hypothetical protein